MKRINLVILQFQMRKKVITSLTYTLISTVGGDTVVFTFLDLDGDGGNPPTVTRGILDTNTTYSGSLTLLNELEMPAEDITAEVRSEGDEHQFFFENTLTGLGIAYDDMDSHGLPIGLSSIVTTSDTSSGTIKITLKHEPDKNAAGVSGGDITNAGGETDIEVTFNVEFK